MWLSAPALTRSKNVNDKWCVQTFRKLGEIDERGFVQRKEAEAAASRLATPPSMSKCQVRTPIRSNR